MKHEIQAQDLVWQRLRPGVYLVDGPLLLGNFVGALYAAPQRVWAGWASIFPSHLRLLLCFAVHLRVEIVIIDTSCRVLSWAS